MTGICMWLEKVRDWMDRCDPPAIPYIGKAPSYEAGFATTTLGHKRIEQFEPVSIDWIRLRITKAKAEPRVHQLAAHFVTDEEE